MARPAGALCGPEAVAASPDGGNVYAASYTSNAIDVFARDCATGALSFTGCVGQLIGCTVTSATSAIDEPRSVVVSPDGSSVYAGSTNAGSATSLGDVDVFTRQLPPVSCTNSTATVQFDTHAKLTLRCSDTDAVSLAFATSTAPSHGTLGPISPSGQVTYTPAAGHSGADSFSYTGIRRNHGHKTAFTLTKTLIARFTVC